MEILPLFCEIDDFCKVFEKLYQQRALPIACLLDLIKEQAGGEPAFCKFPTKLF